MAIFRREGPSSLIVHMAAEKRERILQIHIGVYQLYKTITRPQSKHLVTIPHARGGQMLICPRSKARQAQTEAGRLVGSKWIQTAGFSGRNKLVLQM